MFKNAAILTKDADEREFEDEADDKDVDVVDVADDADIADDKNIVDDADILDSADIADDLFRISRLSSIAFAVDLSVKYMASTFFLPYSLSSLGESFLFPTKHSSSSSFFLSSHLLILLILLILFIMPGAVFC